MVTLFNQIKIEAFFDELGRAIAREIDSLPDTTVVSLDIDKSTKDFISQHKINVPSLVKDSITNPILESQVAGHQLPAGTPFHPGSMYTIEIVNYTIPFNGDSRFFEYIPRNFGGALVEANIEARQLTIPLTRFCKIAGNNEIIELIKNEFIRKVETIELNLNNLSNDVQQFTPILESNIKAFLNKKINQIKMRNESSDKLNPFK
jgi:hypothetical protein